MRKHIVAPGGLEQDCAADPRPLVVADAAAAAGLLARAFAVQPVATDPPSAALRETAASLAAAIRDGGGAGVVGGGALVGVVLWAEREQGLYFGRLAVDPAWRGRGIARRLIAAVEAEAAARGLARVHLSTRLVLHDNRRLFAACGFRETGQRCHDGYAAPTSVIMEKRLAAPVGHNGGPPLNPDPDAPDPDAPDPDAPDPDDPGAASWRLWCWRRARRRAWKTPPPEIALRRLARAEELGISYREYTREILERGRFL